jgi:hypothetical protein
VTNAVQPNKAWGVPPRREPRWPVLASEGGCALRYAEGGKGACINNQPCRSFGGRADDGRAICVRFGRDGGCAGGNAAGYQTRVRDRGRLNEEIVGPGFGRSTRSAFGADDMRATVARDVSQSDRFATGGAAHLNDVFGELQHGLQPRKSKRPQIKQPADCKTSSDHVASQPIILHPSGVQQHRNLVAASGMSGHVYPAPTTAERFARTPNPGDRRPALTRDLGQRDLRTKGVISYHHCEAERDRSPRKPS